MWKDFYKRFNLELEQGEEQSKFIDRIRIALDDLDNRIEPFEAERFHNLHNYPIYSKVASALGKSKEYALKNFLPLNVSFLDTLKVIEAVLYVLNNEREIYEIELKLFYNEVKEAINLSALDLGITFVNGKFYPKGAEELDKILIEDNLVWLKDYLTTKELFENALKHLLNKNYKDAITNAHSSLESLTKTFLGSDARLDKKETRASLIQRVGLNEEWGRILHDFSEIANEYSSRHAKGNNKVSKNELTYELTEFYIYLTGVFIRLISQKSG